jgi:kynurenine formamidase
LRHVVRISLTLGEEKLVIELGHTAVRPGTPAVNSTFAGLRAIVCESVGPVRHEVSVPFHDSQVRGVVLLIQTGWDEHWGTEAYSEPGPFLGEHLIFRMVRSGVKLVGVDFPVIERSVETRLITTGKIPIVENLRSLASLPRVGSRFSALPLEATITGSYAVHAFAEIDKL